MVSALCVCQVSGREIRCKRLLRNWGRAERRSFVMQLGWNR